MVPKFTRLLSVLLAASVLSGCYVLRATRDQLGVMARREPIDKVIEKPGTSEVLKSRLIRARDIREFATRELGLPENRAYRTYVDVGRPYVVWNVVAAPEFSVEPRQWCFPVVGCVAYRGYFREQQANDYAAGLRQAGDDVVVSGVPAYSTLGFMADPLLNTMMNYGELDLAALVFHELAHQVAWVPGDTAFNEAFATVVEEEGVARYAALHASESVLARWRLRRQLVQEITGVTATARNDLAQLYREKIALDVMRERKAARLQKLVADVRAIEQRGGLATGFGNWIASGANNAHLVSVASYYDKVPFFEKLLHAACSNDLPCLYGKVKAEVAARKGSKGARHSAQK